MKRFINGNKIQMGFALSAYLDEQETTDKNPTSSTGVKVLRPAIKFKNLNNIVERNYNNYDEDETGCDDFECEVDEDAEVNVYVNGNLVYGPIGGGSTITIV